MKNWSFRKWFIIYALGVLLMAYATFVPMDMIQPKQVAWFVIMSFLGASGLWLHYQKEKDKKDK